jgi:putative hydrolase of HD superfamily
MEPLAKDLYGFKRTKREVLERLSGHRDVPLVQEFLFKLSGSKASPVCHFVDLVAQLRFQKRWTRVPRIPETSVLGHMFFVALMGFFLSVLCGLPRERWGWNFFGGLLHDLPEALTRDVISPLKRQMKLQDLLAQVEREMMEDQVYPLLPDPLGPLVRFLVEDEFSLRSMGEGGAVPVDSLDQADRLSSIGLPVVDGPLIDLADKYSAFLEAEFSMYYGVSNRVLKEASRAIRDKYASMEYNGVKLSSLFEVMPSQTFS